MPDKAIYHFDEHARLHVWTHDDMIALRVSSGRSDGRGGLLADVLASVGEIPLNLAHINLFSQCDRAKFNHNSLARMASVNDAIPTDEAKHDDWFARLVEIIPTVEAARGPLAHDDLDPLG
jgi:hypothetical protein